MKKGQTEQIFIYIFAIVVIAVLIFLGLKFLGYITATSDKVEFANTLTAIQKHINVAYNLAPGSVIQRQIAIPKSTKFICFIDTDNVDYSKITDSTAKNIIQMRINSGEKDNFYYQLNVKGSNNVDQRIFEKLKISKTLYLTPEAGTITIKLENKGDYVDIYF
ncbi:MAG: hypothetical protein WC413_00060 [Candidatus Nanoarchaeia archaeon]